MAHLVGSAAGFGAIAHKIILYKNIYSYIIFLIAQMRVDILFVLSHDQQVLCFT